MTLQLEKSFLEAKKALPKEDQVKVTACVEKFLTDPKLPGLETKRIQSSLRRSLWEARVNDDLRVVFGREGDCCVLLHVDHHAKALEWARNRGFERNPFTEELQLVHLPVRVIETQADPLPALFGMDDVPRLVRQGVPIDLVPAVALSRRAEDLIDLSGDALPDEVVERLLRMVNGEDLPPVHVASSEELQAPIGRRFTVVAAPEELSAVLEGPIEDWIRFLHPEQKKVAYGDFKGALKVTGSAGTGKTVVALHRARRLARSWKRVLLTSYTTTLCSNLRSSLNLLCSKEEVQRVTVSTIDQQARRLSGVANLCNSKRWDDAINGVLDRSPLAKNEAFREQVIDEWQFVIERQGIVRLDEYLEASRSGRATPMQAADRKRVWEVVESAVAEVEKERSLPPHFLARKAIERLDSGAVKSPYDVVIVDEVQDLGVAHLRLARKLATDEQNGMTLVGDGGQRIYPGGYSLKEMGIDVRGRSHRLELNYRSTLQILRAAERVLREDRDDLDEGMESGWSTRTLLRGPEPRFEGATSETEMTLLVATEVERLLKSGLEPREIAVVARINKLLESLQEALTKLGIPSAVVAKDDQELEAGVVRILTMHRAKGLEFKAVVVAYASDRFLPFYRSLERAREKGDQEEAIRLDRQLLYVAMSRARDELSVFWYGEPTPFLAPVLEGRKK